MARNEIILYGTVGSDIFGDDHFTARQVRGMLEGMRGPLTVRLNSGGGIASEGQAIYTILKDYPDPVEVQVEGVAASAASLIAMAGDRIIMRMGAWMLIHDPASLWSSGRGTADDHAQTAAMLAKIADGYAEIYAAASGRSLDDVRAIMKAETVYTGAEAVAAGFAHETEQTQAAVAASFPYHIYAHAPESLRAAAEARHGATVRERQAVMAAIAGMARTSNEDRNMTTQAAQAVEAAEEPIASKMSAAKMKRLYKVAEQMKLDSSVVTEAIEAGADFDAALDSITSAWAGRGDTGPHMHGLSNAEAQARDRTTSIVGHSWAHGEGLRAKMSDALLSRMDRSHEPHQGRDYANLTLAQMAETVVRAEGLKPWNTSEAVRMASHSSSDFPLILENSISNLVARGIEQRQPDIVRAVHEVRRDDYRAGKALTLSASGMPQEVNEGGEIQFTTVEEKGEILPTLRDFASGFNITNKALVNDRTDLLTDIGSKMVKGAVERLRAEILVPILANSGAGQTMADGKAVFHADHGNLASSGATISVTTLSAARTAMRKQKGLKGEIYAIEPWALIVPPELETVAQQVLATINATTTSDANPFQNSLELIVEPGLSNPDAWYLIGDPTRYDGLALAFLDGQRMPRVETRQGWHTLGLELRLTWALDAKFIETATWYRNAGA